MLVCPLYPPNCHLLSKCRSQRFLRRLYHQQSFNRFLETYAS
ncbi:adenosine deaminases [Zea mays]|uniref:Adenosine deaminases n=1 Tax=Zea mays TaxID=4577 RepID=A0A1D6J5G5_MAIZE|nr:adenosine deaminases [Zea mays]